MRTSRSDLEGVLPAKFCSFRLFVAFLLLSLSAPAQTTIALDRFQPAPPADVFAVTEDPQVPSPKVFGATQAMVTYAHNPLEVISLGSGTYQPVIDDRLWFLAQAQMAAYGWAQLDVLLPFVALNQGSAILGDQGQYQRPSGAALGDIRLGLRVAALDQRGPWPAIGIAGRIWLPTGERAAYTSTGDPRYAGSIILGGDYDHFVYRLSGGRQRQYLHEETAFKLGSDTVIRAALAPRFGPVLVGPELLLSVASNEAEHVAKTSVGNLEALLGANLSLGRWSVKGGLGGALAQRQGTADLRAYLSVGFSSEVFDRRPNVIKPAPPPPPRRRSNQVVIPGRRTRIADDPTLVAGVRKGTQGVTDTEAGAQAVCAQGSAPSTDCAQDRDGDSIPDAEDRCPDEPGHSDPGKLRHGCVKQAVITSTHIELSGRIQFDTGRATLLASSDDILTAIRDTLQENPQLVRVAVEGHTDDVGAEEDNLSLSRQRALAVVRWLVGHGVDERRLEVHGYGPRQPKADNRLPEGRAANRRVEFSIVRRDPRGEAAWADGPAERATNTAPRAQEAQP